MWKDQKPAYNTRKIVIVATTKDLFPSGERFALIKKKRLVI